VVPAVLAVPAAVVVTVIAGAVPVPEMRGISGSAPSGTRIGNRVGTATDRPIGRVSGRLIGRVIGAVRPAIAVTRVRTVARPGRVAGAATVRPAGPAQGAAARSGVATGAMTGAVGTTVPGVTTIDTVETTVPGVATTGAAGKIAPELATIGAARPVSARRAPRGPGAPAGPVVRTAVRPARTNGVAGVEANGRTGGGTMPHVATTGTTGGAPPAPTAIALDASTLTIGLGGSTRRTVLVITAPARTREIVPAGRRARTDGAAMTGVGRVATIGVGREAARNGATAATATSGAAATANIGTDLPVPVSGAAATATTGIVRPVPVSGAAATAITGIVGIDQRTLSSESLIVAIVTNGAITTLGATVTSVMTVTSGTTVRLGAMLIATPGAKLTGTSGVTGTSTVTGTSGAARTASGTAGPRARTGATRIVARPGHAIATRRRPTSAGVRLAHPTETPYTSGLARTRRWSGRRASPHRRCLRGWRT
jgi:hypothetical protein